MKLLRIVALLASLNMSSIYTNGSASPINEAVVSIVKKVSVWIGILCIADGIVEMAEHNSLLPSLEISDNYSINGACKTGIGAVLFVAGQPK